MRASIQASMDVKRDAAGVVDAISAEDMGKFPDTNLAESLQRISGVSISRSNGEGAEVTVRGFGGEFNMITLNGRMMPAANVYGGGSGAGGTKGGSTRAFDFANLASESVSGVQVYKTGRASVATGGIGASINITTARPLDNPGLQFSVGGKLLSDTTNRTGSDVTPEVSGIFSWSDDNEKFGVSLSLSHQQRDSGSSGVAENNWNIGRWDANNLNSNLYSWTKQTDANGAIVNDANGDPIVTAAITNAPADGQLYARPNDIRYVFSDVERTRTNAQLVLQFAPTEKITGTLDYTFAENDIFERRGESTGWMANGNSVDQVTFSDDVVATPLYIHEIAGPRDQGFEQQLRQQTNTLGSLGFNLDFMVTDNFSLKLDAHSSSMESMPTGPGTSGEIAASIGAPVQITHWYDFSGEMPLYNMTIDDSVRGDNSGTLTAGDIGSQVVRVFYAEQTTDINQVKIDGSIEFDNGRFDFGVESRAMEMTERSSNRYMAMGDWGIANVGDIPAALFENFNLADFDDYDASDSLQVGFKGNAEDIAQSLVDTYVVYDDPATTNVNEANDYQVAYNPQFSQNNVVKEDTAAAYVQVAVEGALGDMPTNFLIGMRYEVTDVESSSLMLIPSYLLWQDNNDFQTYIAPTTTQTPFSQEASYDNFLPSLDFDIALTDDIKLRASYSKTIARAGYGNLRSNVSNFGAGGGSTYLGATRTASSANPGLLPLESDNFDISGEWYFADTSYASIGFFEKRVKNFIGTEQVDEEHFGILDQTNADSPRVQEAVAALEAGSFAVDDTSLFVMMAVLDNPADYPNGAADYSNASQFAIDVATAYDIIPETGDPVATWSTSKPVNNREAKLYGTELAVQHFFGESGFGVMANYTIVRGDVKFNDAADPSEDQFALLGLSDTYNLVAMYEKFGVQARLAYNWRDEFLAQSNRGSSRNPLYVEAYSQWDLNVSYEVMDGLSVFFEGINLTGENARTHARNEHQIEELYDLGARFAIGGRYTF